MISSQLYFLELYREIDRTALNSPEREHGTGPCNTEMWLEKHGAILSELDNDLKKLAYSLGKTSVEVVRNDEAVFFCVKQSLVWHMQLVEDLIKKHFPTVQKISFSVDYDPETADNWVNADIEVTGKIKQVVEWENAFIAEWVSEVPYPERNKIRLSCDIM